VTKQEKLKNVQALVERMDSSKATSGGIVSRAREESRAVTEKEQTCMKQAFSDFDTAWEEFRELTGYSKEKADLCKNRDQRHSVAQHLAWWDERAAGAGDDDGDFVVPGARGFDDDADGFEDRSFGKGGPLETRNWSEVQHRSGIQTDAWGEEGNGFRDAGEYFAALASASRPEIAASDTINVPGFGRRFLRAGSVSA